MSLRRLILGTDGMTFADLRRLTQRSSFSRYLPYIAYGEQERLYVNSDETVGFIWECRPLVFAGPQTFTNLEGIFKAGIPAGSVMQFSLYADPCIEPILDNYRAMKVRQGDLIDAATDSITSLLHQGTRGLEKMQGIPVRNFRLLVTLKIPKNKVSKKELYDLRDLVGEVLAGAELAPEPVPPEVLINTLMKLFNDDPPAWTTYDETLPINKQILLGGTSVKTRFSELRIGKKILRCVTAKKMPLEIDPLTFNVLSGDIWGLKSDTNQIKTPYLFTVCCLFENLRSQLHTKCNLVLQQKGIGSLAPSLARKQEEYMWATGEIERGTPFVKLIPLFWHISETEAQASENQARVKRIWESKGFTAQEDRGILNILFLSALPFGLYNTSGNVGYIDRHFICQGTVAAKCLPIQADFSGAAAPVDLYVGRKGQLVTMDVFDKRAINKNCMIAANSGSGKSFFMNYMLFNYYAAGCKIRIIDIGGSYKKLCDIVGGRYIEFTRDSGIVLNPFTNIVDIDEDIGVLCAILCQMVYSSTQQRSTETQMTLIKQAIRHTYAAHGNQGEIDHVYTFLRDYQNTGATSDNETVDPALIAEAGNLAFNLQDFTSNGTYGRWFHGEANLKVADQDFVALELEELKPQIELFRVVVLQVINYITNQLYLAKRRIPTLIVFDESWQFLGRGEDADASMMEDVIEGGYRRGRKYNGSFITIFQSLMDLQKFGGVGKVIRSNSAFKFLLQSDDYENARKADIIDYDPFILNILKSVSTPKPRYSEIFMQTPLASGVARLLVDPVSYWMFTSDPADNERINELREQGMTYAQAFQTLAGQAD